MVLVKRKTTGKIAKSARAECLDEFKDADAKKWTLVELTFNGDYITEASCGGKERTVKASFVRDGIQTFKEDPVKYLAMMYQSNMVNFPKQQIEYKYIHRAGTKGFRAMGISPDGQFTLLMHYYQHLAPFPNNILPEHARDKYTDHMTFEKNLITNFYLPGRGMGVADAPNLKIIGSVDPSDVSQGRVGNCWMLSGISSCAEFDGAIRHLFRKSSIENMPRDAPNTYVVCLYDVTTWKPVDIVIDERLCAHPDGGLLASAPSSDGELWVPLLEKAMSIHCGGWDAIGGGQCTHAWSILTGAIEQYTIRKNRATKKYQCYAKYKNGAWIKTTNSLKESDQTVYQCAWPDVGGGGDEELDGEELFMRMCAWDDENFIMAAGVTGVANTSIGGLVDNHAYSVIECKNDVAGTDVDLIKVRNPWGKGEIENGIFDDDGPGWDEYPQIKKELNPVVADDGIFWVTKQEFFKLFDEFYLSASNMTKFLSNQDAVVTAKTMTSGTF